MSQNQANNTEKTTESSGLSLLSYSTIGAAFKALRHSQSLRQSDVADALQISASAYSHYECCERIPDLSVLIRLSNFYCININYLILIACLDSARSNDISVNDVFRAYSHSRVLPKEDAALLEQCNSLSAESRKNLSLFLSAAISCDEAPDG